MALGLERVRLLALREPPGTGQLRWGGAGLPRLVGMREEVERGEVTQPGVAVWPAGSQLRGWGWSVGLRVTQTQKVLGSLRLSFLFWTVGIVTSPPWRLRGLWGSGLREERPLGGPLPCGCHRIARLTFASPAPARHSQSLEPSPDPRS